MNTTTPETDAMASTMFPDGSRWVQIEDCRKLERELTAVTEQRDRLAEAFESIIGEAAFEGIPESKQQSIHEALQSLNKPTEP